VEAVKKYYNDDREEKDRPQPEAVAEQVGKWKFTEQNDWLEEQLGLLDPLKEAPSEEEQVRKTRESMSFR